MENNIPMVCQICGSETTRQFKKNGYWIRTCGTCKHQFSEIIATSSHANEIYGDDYFQGGKDGYPDYMSEAGLLTARGKKYAHILKKFLQPGTVLDVGCAAGFTMLGLQDAGWRAHGLEPNERMADYARKIGLKVTTGTLENFNFQEQYDLILMLQVLPHFYHLRQALQTAMCATHPHGYWLVETWNRDSIPARLLGQGWPEYSPPSVLHFFSREGLVRLAQQYRFHLIAYGRPDKRLNGQHAKSLLKHNLPKIFRTRLAQTVFHIIPDQLEIPYPAFDICWMLFQQGEQTG